MSRRQKHKHSGGPPVKTLLIFLLFVAVAAFISYRYVDSAASVLQNDRLNVVVYGKQTTVYSLGLREAGNYVISFYPDLKLEVPGGYGVYRVGALGKLVALEKNPEILKKTFSLATSSFIDYHFYKSSQEVYFGDTQKGKMPSITYPGIPEILFDKSNASLGEKLAIMYVFLKTPPQQYNVLPIVEKEEGGGRYLLTDNFSQQYQGYFYRKTYREEKKDVQILYSKNYDSADRISKILQGNGIRVSDISQSTTPQSQCRVRERTGPFSATAISISEFFGCELVKGKTDIYDILVELGTREREW